MNFRLTSRTVAAQNCGLSLVRSTIDAKMSRAQAHFCHITIDGFLAQFLFVIGLLNSLNRSLSMPKRSKPDRKIRPNQQTPEEKAETQIAEARRMKGKSINLTRLNLTAVPESLPTLRNIGSLDLSANRIESLPSCIGELSELSAINLSFDRLVGLPPEIGNLHKLTALFLIDNQLETLPEEITKLYRLRSLELDGNPKLGMPGSILRSAHARAIISYYFESRREEGEPLLELKLLLVGRGKAGKTTLVKRLVGEQPLENESDSFDSDTRTLAEVRA
jgi:Leucine-rich repeat (LRR) protein